MSLYIVILAGGLGTRMKSDIPKVLHKVQDEPMLVRIVKQAQKLNPVQTLIVAGKYKPLIENAFSTFNIKDTTFIEQKLALGTGHAVMCCRDYLLEQPLNSRVLVLSGDTPLIMANTVKEMLDFNKVKIMTTEKDNPFGYGRILQLDNLFSKIVEQKDATLKQQLIKKVNCGIYSFNNKMLCKYLPYIDNKNVQNEYYLTDLIEIIKVNENVHIDMFNLSSDKQYELTNVNDREQLAYVNKLAMVM